MCRSKEKPKKIISTRKKNDTGRQRDLETGGGGVDGLGCVACLVEAVLASRPPAGTDQARGPEIGFCHEIDNLFHHFDGEIGRHGYAL